MNMTSADVQDYLRRHTEYYTQLEPINELTNMRINLTNSNIETYVRKHAYIVGSVSESGLSISEAPVTHPTIIEARAECQRLAKLNPGKNFIALQLGALERVAYQPNVSI